MYYFICYISCYSIYTVFIVINFYLTLSFWFELVPKRGSLELEAYFIASKWYRRCCYSHYTNSVHYLKVDNITFLKLQKNKNERNILNKIPIKLYSTKSKLIKYDKDTWCHHGSTDLPVNPFNFNFRPESNTPTLL